MKKNLRRCKFTPTTQGRYNGNPEPAACDVNTPRPCLGTFRTPALALHLTSRNPPCKTRGLLQVGHVRTTPRVLVSCVTSRAYLALQATQSARLCCIQKSTSAVRFSFFYWGGNNSRRNMGLGFFLWAFLLCVHLPKSPHKRAGLMKANAPDSDKASTAVLHVPLCDPSF